MVDRITSDKITKLKGLEVFVFGSNEAGIHGAGAAKAAIKWGAVFGVGFGLSAMAYAIPTKDMNIETLPLRAIKFYVDMFIEDALVYTEYTFLVTEIGCGLAGYTPEDIAPLFKEAALIPNIHLPEKFWAVLNANTILHEEDDYNARA